MISESVFSKGYSTFWSEVTPWLNNFTQLVNKRYLSKVFTELSDLEDSKFRSINGILAFNFYKKWVEGKKPTISETLEQSRPEITRFSRNSFNEYELSDLNTQIVENLAQRLRYTFDEDLVFNPRFQGCGILGNCEADIISGTSLIEVKTGDRLIAPSDIRQLLVYVGLNEIAGGAHVINDVQYFNPRKGVLWRSSISELFNSISTIPLSDFSNELEGFLVSQSDIFNFT